MWEINLEHNWTSYCLVQSDGGFQSGRLPVTNYMMRHYTAAHDAVSSALLVHAGWLWRQLVCCWKLQMWLISYMQFTHRAKRVLHRIRYVGLNARMTAVHPFFTVHSSTIPQFNLFISSLFQFPAPLQCSSRRFGSAVSFASRHRAWPIDADWYTFWGKKDTFTV